jgi:hypothetical protein
MRNRTEKIGNNVVLNYVVGTISDKIYTSNVSIIWNLKKVYLIMIRRRYQNLYEKQN